MSYHKKTGGIRILLECLVMWLTSFGWKDARETKPGMELVVLIHVNGLAEYGIVSAWWCAEDYKWIALDDAVQFDEENVNWWRPIIHTPDT